MIYVCTWCRKEIRHLRTPGDEVCALFPCTECAEKDRKEWKHEIVKAAFKRPRLFSLN